MARAVAARSDSAVGSGQSTCSRLIPASASAGSTPLARAFAAMMEMKKIDVAGDRVIHRRTAAAVGHMGDLDARLLAEHRHGEMA